MFVACNIIMNVFHHYGCTALHCWMWGLQRVADINRLLEVQQYIKEHPADYIPERLQFIQSKVSYTVGSVKEAEEQIRGVIFKTDEPDNVLTNATFSKFYMIDQSQHCISTHSTCTQT